MRPRPRATGQALSTSPFVRTSYVAPTTADFHIGDRVTLDSHGLGRVIDVTDEYVVVDFGTAGRGHIPAGAKGFSRL
jgi:hypothetical protein